MKEDFRCDVIFVSLEAWDEVWRRNQFVCSKLAERNAATRILFVEPAVDVSNAVRTRRWHHLWQPRFRKITPDGRITATRAVKWFPNTVSWMRKLNEWMMRRHIRRIARRLGFKSPALWINAHGAVHMVERFGEDRVIYDVTDDWSAFPEAPAAAALTRAQDRELCQRADTVIVCSERLWELKEPLARRTELVPNGVDLAHYASASDKSLPIPEETRGWRRPVLGYTGSVHPDRVDVQLIAALAQRMPAVTLAFVGPMMLPPEDVRKLQKFPNIVLLGQRPYARVAEYMRAFDVCMVPHLVTPFTESLNPIKLWEYLAAGLPIIATPVAGFRDFSELVYLARNAEEIAATVQKALRETPERAAERQAIAAQHTWERRVAQIEKLLGWDAATCDSRPAPALPTALS